MKTLKYLLLLGCSTWLLKVHAKDSTIGQLLAKDKHKNHLKFYAIIGIMLN